VTHVPYKGATQAAVDTRGRCCGFQGIATVAWLVRSGKLRLIGVTTLQRRLFADVLTVSESGLPGFGHSWFTVMAPAGTPKEIIARLNEETWCALADPETREKLVAQDHDPRHWRRSRCRHASSAKYARPTTSRISRSIERSGQGFLARRRSRPSLRCRS
jgi:tripartite-type tricarboxylate transporter receptor subunit TctC